MTLKLRKHDSNEGMQSVHSGPQVITGEALKAKRIEEKKAAKKDTLKNKESSILEWVVLVLVTAPLAYFLWLQSKNPEPEYMELYTAARMPVLVVAWLLVVVQAFKSTRLSGVISIIFPPYWVFFLLTEVDHKIIRGAVTGFVIILALEIAMVPKHAFLNNAQASFNQVVAKGQGALSSEENLNIR